MNIRDCIYITFDQGKTWSILCRLSGEPYTQLHAAIKFVRLYITSKVGLSTYEQMKVFNTQWDNY